MLSASSASWAATPDRPMTAPAALLGQWSVVAEAQPRSSGSGASGCAAIPSAAASTVLIGPHSTSPAGDSQPSAAGPASTAAGAPVAASTVPTCQPRRLSHQAPARAQPVTTAPAAGHVLPVSSCQASSRPTTAASSGSSVPAKPVRNVRTAAGWPVAGGRDGRVADTVAEARCVAVGAVVVDIGASCGGPELRRAEVDARNAPAA